MSDILIKGMEMPTSCYDCDFIQHSYPKDWCYITEKNLPCNCPLVPVPPHGRCVDESALLAGCGYIIADGMACIQVKYIAKAPTIIPAEEGET